MKPNVASAGETREVDLAGAALRTAADGLPELVGGSCAQCATAFFPLSPVCPLCAGGVSEAAMPRRGVVYSLTNVHVGPQRWRKPFAVGYVDLDNGVRLFAHLRGAAAIGARVELRRGAIGVEADGTPVVGFVFESAV